MAGETAYVFDAESTEKIARVVRAVLADEFAPRLRRRMNATPDGTRYLGVTSAAITKGNVGDVRVWSRPTADSAAGSTEIETDLTISALAWFADVGSGKRVGITFVDGGWVIWPWEC